MSVRSQRITIPARSRAATRERLLDAATTLFAQRGFHGVTSREIAGTAGAAAGTFYIHFRDKRDVLREIVARGIVELRRRLAAAAGLAGASVEDRVRARTEGMLQFAETNRDLVRVLFDPACGANDQVAGALELLSSTPGRGGSEETDTRAGATDLDSTVVAEAIKGMLTRVVAWWAEEPGRVPRETVVRTLTRFQRLAGYPSGARVGVSIRDRRSS